jgi:uncharacterized membrane protein YcjF (UPF0283 family)
MAGVLTARQKRRRKVVLAALCTIAVMAIGGSFFPVEHISKRFAAWEVIYWLICFLMVAIIPIAAIREFRETLKMQGLSNMRQDRDTAFKEIVETVAKAEIESKRKAELPSRNGHG